LRERRALPFPILAGSDLTVIRQWGIFNFDDLKGRAIPHPATFVVGRDGLITWAHVGKTTRDRPTPGAVLAAVRDASAEGTWFQPLTVAYHNIMEKTGILK
jgi:peroxiredoxin